MRDLRTDALVAAALLALTGVELAFAGADGPGGRAAGAVTLAVAALAAARRRAPFVVTVLAAGLAAVTIALYGADADGPDTLLLSLGFIAFAAGDGLPAGRSRAAVAVLVAGTYGAQLAFAGGNPSPPLLFATAAPWLAGTVARSRRELSAQLQDTVAALDRERAAYVELAVERERRAIARELHDIVGHAMSLIVIQAAAGRHLAERDPDGAGEALDAIADAGRQASADVGRLRALLAAPGAEAADAGLDELPALVARAAAAGQRVRVTHDGAARITLAPAVDHAAFRLLQEALSNTVKHASGADVDVTLGVRDGALHVDVRNGAGRMPRALASGGRGLRGMAERVAAAGGELDAGPDGDGWRVTATLPAAPAGTVVPARSST